MGKQKIKIKNGVYCISNRLKQFERVNPEELKILTNGTVSGLLPVEVIQRRRVELHIQAYGMLSLEEAVNERLDTETLLTFIGGALKIALDCESMGLRIDNLCWDFRRVFVDPSNRRVCMCYWPVVHLHGGGNDALTFFVQFYRLMIRDKADADVTEKYRQYFYQRDTLNLVQFQSRLQTIWEEWQRQQSETLEINGYNIQPAKYVMAQQNRQAWDRAWLQSSTDSKKIWINRNQIVIGRSRQDCNVEIKNDKSVSRCHALVMRQEESYFLVDLGSTNGTFVNDRQLAPQIPVRLTDGSVVRLGNSCFVFREFQDANTLLVQRKRGGES